MPRKTRRQMVGKEEDIERQERERALERLCWELRRRRDRPAVAGGRLGQRSRAA